MEERADVEEIRREQILRAAYDVAAERGLGGLTVRSVAARAEVSHALVLFYFGRKAGLMMGLLEWLIANSTVLHVSQSGARHPHALDRLHALLQQEMSGVVNEPRQTRLFFEFWALGARHPEIRSRIAPELERYRGAFRTVLDELLIAEPATFAGTTAAGLAAVAVSWVQGCAVQMMIDPDRFDTEEYLVAVRSLMGGIAPRGRADDLPSPSVAPVTGSQS